MPDPPRLEILAPDTLTEALELKAERPDAVPLAGGTDLMVALNFRHARPGAVLDLTRVPELRDWAPRRRPRARRRRGHLHAPDRRAGRPPARPGDRQPHGRLAPDPQPRHGRGQPRDRVARPATALPPLYTADAVVEVASTRGTRRIPVAEFVTGPKRTCLADDELICAFDVAAAAGPQQFAKVGTRNAMVIAVCSVSLALWPEERRVATCIGSAGPTPLRAPEAEAFIAGALDEHDLWDARPTPIPDAIAERFGALVGAAARPIDDVRGTADYRRHAVGVLARRALRWTWEARA